MQIKKAEIIRDPEQCAHKREDQDHAESADGAQRGAQVDDVADQKDQPDQHRDRQLILPVGHCPAGEVIGRRVVGGGDKSKGEEPTQKESHECSPFQIAGAV